MHDLYRYGTLVAIIFNAVIGIGSQVGAELPDTPTGQLVAGVLFVAVMVSSLDQTSEFFYGEPESTTALHEGDVDNGTRPFYISTTEPNFRYEGAVDEVFAVDRALTDEEIARIHACGIDGSLCTCDSVEPAMYVSCGRVNLCENLAPCNHAL